MNPAPPAPRGAPIKAVYIAFAQMGWYDPRAFLDGCTFLKDADKANIVGLNAARLLKLKAPAPIAASTSAPCVDRKVLPS
jgi:hypothetical protein